MTLPSSHHESHTFRAGALIGARYEIVRKLGAGGMGAVYLARMAGLGKLVALKVFGSIDNPTMRRRFEREAAMALDMSHPGAAQVLDVGEHVADGQRAGDGYLFIVMEFIEGDDVSTLLDVQSALNFTDARAIVRSVAQTLAYAHHKGVVHRDIKPANIRVKRDVAGWQVKVLDFGIARIVDDVSTRLTQEGSITGTPRYMAPEQIRNEAVDGRADVYALGLVLFEMLTGRDPFARDTVAQVLWAQMNDVLPSISVLQPTRHSLPIDDLLAKACAKLPAQRFASATEFLQALDALEDPQFGAAGLLERRRSKTGGSGSASGASYSDDYASSPSAAGTKRAISVPVTVGGARQRTWLALGLGGAAVVLAGGALWVALQGRGPNTPTTNLPTTNAGQSSLGKASNACSLSGVSPAIANLSIAQLEARAEASRIMMPSVAARQLKTLKLTADKYPEGEGEGQRSCLLRRMLAQSIEQESVVIATTPTLWGQGRSLDELKKLLISTPFVKNYSSQERQILIDKVETMFIANLQKNHPGDGDYWRRMYYGIVINCEATDDARKALGIEAIDAGSCVTIPVR
jgi:eukaryotic-like serine/threonine-protein kinase